MTTREALRPRVERALDTLPEEALREVAAFIQTKAVERPEVSAAAKPPYTPVPLGGIWRGVGITDEDIAEVRREMWSFGDREL